MTPSSAGAARPSSSATCRTSSGCHTRSGGRPTGATRSFGTAVARSSPVLASEVGLDQVGAALCRRIDDRVVGRMQRPLGERREGADLLDLVSEELDAERLSTGRGEDVDDPAPHGELPALLDPVDPLVAGQREPLREAVDAGLVADAELERRRSRVERR